MKTMKTTSRSEYRKWRFLATFVLCLGVAGCVNNVELTSAEHSETQETANAANQANANLTGLVLENQVVEASCGQCQFGMGGDGCDLAIRYQGQTWFVEGTSIDDHGDAHSDDGFCNAIRQARVTGKVEGDRFLVESFELVDTSGENNPGE